MDYFQKVTEGWLPTRREEPAAEKSPPGKKAYPAAKALLQTGLYGTDKSVPLTNTGFFRSLSGPHPIACSWRPSEAGRLSDVPGRPILRRFGPRPERDRSTDGHGITDTRNRTQGSEGEKEDRDGSHCTRCIHRAGDEPLAGPGSPVRLCREEAEPG